MATQLGDVQINSIEGNTVRGWFRSRKDKNVYDAYPGWGASLLHDAYAKLCGIHRSEPELAPFIKSVTFETPGTASTEFTIEVNDPSVLSDLKPGSWDSYYLG